jgi:hypothetical protein
MERDFQKVGVASEPPREWCILLEAFVFGEVV